jgi:hypothetical protein
MDMPKLLLGFLFAAHGVIHLGYVTPAPSDPNYPFSLDKSWLVTGLGLSLSTVHAFGTLLAIVTVVGYALAGLSAAGIIVPHVWWQSLTVIASVASLLLLVLFWHNWLILGVVIDIALLALIASNWQPFAA